MFRHASSNDECDIAVCKKFFFGLPPFQALPRHGWAMAGAKQLFFAMKLPLNRAPPLNMKVVQSLATSL